MNKHILREDNRTDITHHIAEYFLPVKIEIQYDDNDKKYYATAAVYDGCGNGKDESENIAIVKAINDLRNIINSKLEIINSIERESR